MSDQVGIRVLREEAEAIAALANNLGDAFSDAVRLILECKGRTFTCGIGKSGHIARKTAGTLSSTGTPSGFLHAAEAVHGDLGMVAEGDVVILYSHSGETDEIVKLFPALRSQGATTLLMTGRKSSSAGRLADLVLDTQVVTEACPNNLAPTTSTTVMLAMSDALAVSVMESRGFGPDDFAKFHPSGALGKRLLLTVRDVMRKGTDLSIVSPTTPVLDLLRSITQAGAGAACVVNSEGNLIGFVSDGDLRRHFLNSSEPFSGVAEDLMHREVTSLSPDLLAVEALEVFQNHPVKIGEAPIIENGKPVGMLMVKDLLRSGIV